jgi:hypothetical protein
MAWDIQINPTAESIPINYGLVELLSKWAVDYEMKYCYVEKDPDLVAALRKYRPADDVEARAVANLIGHLSALEDEDRVELLFGH